METFLIESLNEHIVLGRFHQAKMILELVKPTFSLYAEFKAKIPNYNHLSRIMTDFEQRLHARLSAAVKAGIDLKHFRDKLATDGLLPIEEKLAIEKCKAEGY